MGHFLEDQERVEPFTDVSAVRRLLVGERQRIGADGTNLGRIDFRLGLDLHEAAGRGIGEPRDAFLLPVDIGARDCADLLPVVDAEHC